MATLFKLKVFLSFVSVYFIWGSNYLATRVTLDTIPAYFSLALRLCIAVLIIFLWLGPRKITRVTRRQWTNAFMVGFLLHGLGTGPVVWAIYYVPTGVTAILVAMLPVWFILFEKLLKGNSGMGFVGWIGIAISIAGSLILMGGTSISTLASAPLIPFLMIFFACMCWAFGSIWSTILETPPDNLTNVLFQMAGGIFCNLLLSLLMGEWQDLKTVTLNFEFLFAMLYLSIFCSLFVFAAYNFLLANFNSTLVSTHSYINPLVAVFLGWIYIDEAIDARVMLASVMILGGVVCIRMGIKKTRGGQTSKWCYH